MKKLFVGFLVSVVVMLSGCAENSSSIEPAECDSGIEKNVDAEECVNTIYVSNESPASTLEDELDFDWLEFFMSEQYWRLRLYAFEFVRALYTSDIDALTRLAASPDSDFWAWYLDAVNWTAERSLNDVISYVVSVETRVATINYYEIGGELFREFFVIINMEDATVERRIEIQLGMIFIPNSWKITWFGFG